MSRCAGFLSNTSLYYQSSPSGRTLLAHAAYRRKYASWINGLLQAPAAAPPPQPVPSILRRALKVDNSRLRAQHALDYALENHDFYSLKALLKAVKALPPRCAPASHRILALPRREERL